MRKLIVILIVAFAFLLGGFCFGGASDDWKPVSAEELALKQSVVEKNADAEAMFWEIRVTDELDGQLPHTVYANYVRIKLFTSHGMETQGKVEIPYLNGRKVRDISGRTIKADGTIVELKKDAIFDRTVIQAGKEKIQAKSFAMPALEPGAIIEYRWTEVHGDQLANYVHLNLDMNIPAQTIKYFIKPLRSPFFPFAMRSITFHGKTTPFTPESNGFVSTTISSVPAFHAEPHMPPQNEVRPWMLIYYAADKKLEPASYWQQYSKSVFDEVEPLAKVSDDVKRAALQIIGDAKSPEDKLAKLYEYARLQVKRSDDLTPEEKEKFKPGKTAAETLKRGIGTNSEMNMLFLALATAADFDARFALLGDRSTSFFNPAFPDSYFLRSRNIAVRLNDQWRFFDPSNKYLPFGALRWQEEGTPALISDPKETIFVTTPISPATFSATKRMAKVKLSSDGTLEGELHLIYLGQLGIEMKRANQNLSEDERKKVVADLVTEYLHSAQVTDIQILNAVEPTTPVGYSCHIKVPGYAQKTGSRLFFQPKLFAPTKPEFPSDERRYPMYWPFPWSADDTVDVTLPDGYELDNADSPGAIRVANVAVNEIKIQFSPSDRTLHYQSHMAFGLNNTVMFPVDAYHDLKAVFDRFFEQDTHMISVKQAADYK